MVMKTIFKHFTGTKDLSLWYPRDGDLKLIRYSNIDNTDYKVDRKSTSGLYQFVG